GAERRSSAMTQQEKELTAYHEAGHAIVGLFVPAGIPVHKATIIPRGRALGMVKFLPEGDRYSMKYKEFTSQLAVAMGGRVAEELTFGKENITSGAQGDIQQATKMARTMVTQLGYSDELGLVAYGDNQEEVFLGMSMGKQQNVSEETAQLIDKEVKRLVHEGYVSARDIITERHDQFVSLAEALLEYETLTGDEIKDLLNGKRPSREPTDEPPAPRSSSVPTVGKQHKPPEPDTGGMEPQPGV
ncbi:MAG: cell division protein FtsH, partial [Hyphomicrobiales bacterium]|nr:cell division protein FtsH [Hyphomicrobiales bacterium]